MINEREGCNEKHEKRGLVAAKRRLDDSIRRKFQALAAVVTLVSVLVWAEVSYQEPDLLLCVEIVGKLPNMLCDFLTTF